MNTNAQLVVDKPRRRKSQRIRLNFPIEFRTRDNPDKPMAGIVQDLSVAGILILTAERVEIASKVMLFFNPLPGERQARRIGGLVTRTEVVEGVAMYRIGVKFASLNDRDRSDIAAALYNTDIMGLLRLADKDGASDLHLSADHPPIVRIAGQLGALKKQPLSGRDLKHMVYTLLDDRQIKAFERNLELDISVSVSPMLRYRVNVHMQRGNVEASFRRIEPAVQTLAGLNLPPVMSRLADFRDGLVLVTGPTGAGKTTAVAAMVNHINAERAAVIITLENPIEYVYEYRRSVIKQREIGVDSQSYPAALKEAMRQDPDVIVIGEIRDEETMKAAMDAGETGHLVVATFPATNCVQSILRAFHFFPKGRQQEIQLQLANCLRGIVSLRLLPRVDRPGVIPATEVLMRTEGVANMIRNGSIEQLPSAIQTGSRHGMHSLSASLEKLLAGGYIDRATAKECR
jgi:twitching motility protein PilT